MNKLFIKDFEFQISANTWSTAQDLAHAGRVRAMQEVERHFWVARVEDEDGIWESEIILSPTKIKEFACSCWGEPRRFMCPHIAAALLKIRQFLEQKAEERAQKAAERQPQSALSRITIREVLADIPQEALLEFVRHYARRDRDFATAVKTWFAGSLTGTDNPYHLLLDGVLPKATKIIKEVDFRRLRRTLQDLELQLSSMSEKGDLTLMSKISLAILLKISPFLKVVEGEKNEELIAHCKTAISYLQKTTEQENTSPALRQQIWTTVFEGLMQQQYHSVLRKEIVRFLTTAAGAAQWKQITTAFMQSSDPPSEDVLLLYLCALAKQNMLDAVPRVLSKIALGAATSSITRNMIVDLFYLQQEQAAALTIDYFMDTLSWSPQHKRELEQLQFTIAEKIKDGDKMRLLLRNQYIKMGNAETLIQLKSMAAAAWPDEMQVLLAHFQSHQQIDRIATLLASEGETQVLEAFLEKNDDFKLLQRFEDALSNDFIYRKYSALFSAYLAGHFGHPASIQVRNWMANLAKKGKIGLVKQISGAITAQFPERENLPETLSDLWLKKIPAKSWS